MYGNGRLNLGALGVEPKKVARVAVLECPEDSTKIGEHCVYTFAPLEYYVIKDGANFLIYGPTVSEKFKEKGWTFHGDTSFKGAAYSVAKAGFTPINLTYKELERDGEKVPAFAFDYQTAQKIQGSRFVEMDLSTTVKIRFNMFNIPDKDLVNR